MHLIKLLASSRQILLLRSFLTKHWLPVAGFFISAGLTITFSVTFLADAIHFNDPRNQDVDLESWMTPRYVILSYDLPRSLVHEALELDTDPDGRPPRMRRVARDLDLTLEELTARIRSAAADHRSLPDD